MSDNFETHHEVLFYEALDLPEGERNRFLDKACGGNEELRAEVDELLQAHEGAAGFLPREGLAAPELQREVGRINPEQAGDHLGSYKLLEQIGEGGFGTVWVAEQEKPVRRRVALKIIKPGMDTKEVIARFEQERQALAMMDHPNIARVLDAGATPLGRPFFVMELVRGTRITEFCDQANLSTAERLRIFIAVCHAVQHAHQKGIIHRDLKPSNILVTLHDGVPVPKVIDFGIAKATQQQRLTDLTIYTQFEQLIGTPLYMSPEQVERSGLDIDTRSDIYSLGVLLYELLVGRPPFDPETLMKRGVDEIRRVVREQEPQKPSTFVSTMALDLRAILAQHRQTDGAKLIAQIRGDLDWIVMKALEKDRARRYETTNNLAEDIQRHLGSEPVQARPPTRLYRFRRFAKRNKIAFGAGTGIVASLLIGMAVSTWMLFKEKHARERAVAAEQKATTEASKSQQVAQFLKDMLNGVGPSVALGRDTKMLREILDKTAERVGKDLQDQPEVDAELRSVIGDVFSALGEIANAGAMHREALALRKKSLGNDDPAVASSLSNLANTLGAEAAEPRHREALAMRRKLLGNEHPDVAESLVSLAVLLRSQGKLNEAEALAGEAVAICRKSFGSEHPRMAGALVTLASVVGHQGRSAEAEVIHREVLEMRKNLLGNNHPDVAESSTHLAQALRDQNKLAESESLFREALRIQRKLFGDQGPMVYRSLSELVDLYQKHEMLAEAETLLREFLLFRRNLLENDHARLAYVVNDLAKIMHLQNKLAEAEILRRESLALARKLLGSEHRNIATMLSNLGVELMGQRKFAEAESLFRDALEMRRKLLGNEHPELAISLNNLGGLLHEQGNLSGAETLYREALEMQRKLRINWYPDMARTLRNLGDVILQQGKWAEAETLRREGLAAARQAAAEDPSRLETAQLDMAEPLYRQRKYPEAAELYREAFESRKARLAAGHPDVIGSSASLARLLADWAWSERGSPSGSRNENPENAERAREAESLLRDCLATRLRGPEAGHWRTTGDVPSRLGSALVAVAVTDPSLASGARMAKLVEAESLLLAGNKALAQGGNVDAKYQRDSLIRLVHLYEACDKPDQAAAWKRKLADFDKSGAPSEAGTNAVHAKP